MTLGSYMVFCAKSTYPTQKVYFTSLDAEDFLLRDGGLLAALGSHGGILVLQLTQSRIQTPCHTV